LMGLTPQLIVGGVSFDIERDDDGYWLKHPKWSIAGYGRTLVDAEIDLLREATEDAPYYTSKPRHEMTEEARLLTDWLLRVTPVKTT
jgi:hypothetical protein